MGLQALRRRYRWDFGWCDLKLTGSLRRLQRHSDLPVVPGPLVHHHLAEYRVVALPASGRDELGQLGSNLRHRRLCRTQSAP